ncbi:aldolase [Patescibacteria group bacterium]|nr:aldolase [Patescibacteria group bacterium]
MTKTEKSLKQRLKNGDIVFGVWNSIPSSTLVDVIGSSGIDFIVIDAEHGPVGMETAEDLVRAAQVSGMSSLIRVSTNEAPLILRALDIGAHGVQVPHITTKEEAKQVVRFAKYYPQGVRGFSPFTRAASYGIQTKGYTKKANDETLVVVNIEGKEGTKNIEDIAGIAGIDVIFIGPYDLSQSLGKPGEVRDSEIIDTIKRTVAIADKHGIACGSFAPDESYLELLIECGVRYLTYMVDTAFIAKAYKKVFDSFCKNKERRES